ncbi:hypothetical protein B0H17DRAFT_1216282 [Mycena rosella]|uniref:SET domain-containing protein n=1 Tax=Mycena rosella TaxID=1033263 RepID=A0AAD7FX84_MYCRO|nr:hypothetical protein B0H17DRAFT_1216282 [Mycena rosella]
MRLEEDSTSGAQAFSVVDLSVLAGSYATDATCPMLLDASIVPVLHKRFNLPPPGPSPPAFIIADAGTKGVGLFATRDIPAGALILVERPIIVVPAIVPFPRKTVAYAALLPHLSQAARAALLGLTNCKPPSECGPVEGIVWTNASQIDLPILSPTAAEYGGVFPHSAARTIGRLCDLSTTLKWDLASFSIAMYAQRAHAAGEELHIQYIDVLVPRAARRTQLARSYGFECARAHYTQPDDAARAALAAWPQTREFLPWTTDLLLADDAGMQIPFLEEIALSFALLGDARGFRVWAQRVVKLCSAQDPEGAGEFTAWMKSPQTFRLWGWRAKQRRLLDKQLGG